MGWARRLGRNVTLGKSSSCHASRCRSTSFHTPFCVSPPLDSALPSKCLGKAPALEGVGTSGNPGRIVIEFTLYIAICCQSLSIGPGSLRPAPASWIASGGPGPPHPSRRPASVWPASARSRRMTRCVEPIRKPVPKQRDDRTAGLRRVRLARIDVPSSTGPYFFCGAAADGAPAALHRRPGRGQNPVAMRAAHGAKAEERCPAGPRYRSPGTAARRIAGRWPRAGRMRAWHPT